MITLGGRSFAGPYMAPLWSAPRSAGLYAVMAPGWRLLTFRALDFEQAADAEAEAKMCAIDNPDCEACQ